MPGFNGIFFPENSRIPWGAVLVIGIAAILILFGFLAGRACTDAPAPVIITTTNPAKTYKAEKKAKEDETRDLQNRPSRDVVDRFNELFNSAFRSFRPATDGIPRPIPGDAPGRAPGSAPGGATGAGTAGGR
jgi:hypothetical protein